MVHIIQKTSKNQDLDYPYLSLNIGTFPIGIIQAIPIVIGCKPDVLAVLERPLGVWPSMILMVGTSYWLYLSAKK